MNNYDIMLVTDFLNAPEIRASQRLFGQNNVTISLVMRMPTQNASYGTLYNISLSITPDPIGDIVSTESNYVQLTLLYNTRYNVSAVATLCRESSDTTYIELFYGKSVTVHLMLEADLL